MRMTLFLLVLCAAIHAHAQGPDAVVTGRVTDSAGLPVSSGYAAALYFAPGNVTDDGVFLRVGGPLTLNANGLFSTSVTVPPAPGPSPWTLYATAWETAFGSSYEAASLVQGAHVGRSVFVNVNLPGPGPIVTQVRIPDFQVAAVPEPSTIVLGIFGAVSLLLVRRRK